MRNYRQFRILSVIFVSFLASFLIIKPALADERFFTRNNIIFYNKDGFQKESESEEGNDYQCDDSLPPANKSVGKNNSTKLSTGLMEIKNPKKFAEAIDTWIKKTNPNSPAVGMGKIMVKSGMNIGINPIMPAIIGRMESQLGKTGGIKSSAQYCNMFGRKASPSQPKVPGTNYYAWDGCAAALGGDKSYYHYLKRVYGVKDSRSFLEKYAPSSDGNNVDNYDKSINQWAKEIYSLAGDSINVGNFGSTSNSSSPCIKSDSPGAGPAISSSNGSVQVLNRSQLKKALSENKFIHMQQIKGDWSKKIFVSDGRRSYNYYGFGCTATCVSIIHTNMLKIDRTPDDPAYKRFLSSGGISMKEALASAKELNVSRVDMHHSAHLNRGISDINNTLNKGGMAILYIKALTKSSKTPFTTYGHAVVIRGRTSGGDWIIADPAGGGGDVYNPVNIMRNVNFSTRFKNSYILATKK